MFYVVLLCFIMLVGCMGNERLLLNQHNPTTVLFEMQNINMIFLNLYK